MEELHYQEGIKEVKPGLAKEDDAEIIVRLQNENLPVNVPEEERRSLGYTTVETSVEDVKNIIGNEGVIVVRNNNKVVGYLMPMTLERAERIPLFRELIARFDNLEYEERTLSSYNACILAQICIEKDFRGGSSLRAIHDAAYQHLRDKYQIGVTDIASDNLRSLKANIEKIGMKLVGEYNFAGTTWKVVLSDFRE